MECKEIEHLIIPFIKYELSEEQLKEFLNHVETCPNCKEELEIYYMVYEGMKGLDEDDFTTYNLKDALLYHIEQGKQYLKEVYGYKVFKYALTTVSVIGLICAILIQLRIWLL